MATVTGTLTDFGLNNLFSFSPRLFFTPSTVGVLNGQVFATKPVRATIFEDASFSVELQPTEALLNDVYYSVSISYLNTGGTYISLDLPEWKVRVPDEGGPIGELITAAVNPRLTWVDEDPPIAPTAGQLWLVPSTGDLYRWEV